MKKRLSLFLLTFVALFAFKGNAAIQAVNEDSYTITFKECDQTDGDSNTQVASLDDLISDGVGYVKSFTKSNVYQARVGRGIKLGTSSKTGSLTLVLETPIKPTKIVVSARAYNSSEKTFKLFDKEYSDLTTDFADITATFDGNTEVSEITMETTSKRCYVKSVTVYFDGDTPTPSGPSYYVVGSMNQWEISDAYKLKANAGAEGEYMYTGDFKANDEIKVKSSEGNWYPDTQGSNYVFQNDGNFTIYFRPAGNQDWPNNYFYVAENVPEVKDPSTSLNIEQLVLDEGTTADIASILTRHNIEFKDINALDSLNDEKTARNEPFLGLKVKKQGGFINVVLEKGKTLKVKFGCVNAPVTVSIDGTPINEQIAANTAGGDVFTLDAADADREVTFTTTTAKTVVFKQIMIGEDIAEVTLPAPLKTFTATFTTDYEWEKVYAYAWTGETPIKAWPGEEITSTLKEGVYTYTFKAAEAPANIIFNNGSSGEGNQTEDLVFEDGKAYSFNKPEPQPEPELVGYYVVGTMNEWKYAEAYQMQESQTAQGIYEYTAKLAAGEEFKVRALLRDVTGADVEGTWYPADLGNFVIQQNGEYTITFNPAGGVEDWYGGYINVAMKEEPIVVNTYTATVTNDAAWNEVYAYAWTKDAASGEVTKFLGDWPGTPLVPSNNAGEYLLSFQAEAAPDSIIFNNGSGEQTADLAFENGGTYTNAKPEVQKYNVILYDGMVNGTVEADKYEAAEGDQVLLKVTPNENYEIDQVSVIDVTGAPIETRQIIGGDYNYAFVMPGGDVNVSATFKEAAADEYHYEKATSIAVGDVVVLAAEGVVKEVAYAKELSELKDKIGVVADYTDVPAGIVELTVEEGSQDGTFAFGTPDSKYLAANTSNQLPLADAIADASSWTVTWTDGVPTITNVAQSARVLQYNSGSPRFACYTTTQKAVTLWKKVAGPAPQPADIKTLAINGEFPGMSWDPAEGIQMQQEETTAGLWTLEQKNVTVEGKPYEYKAFADGVTDGYQLPAQGNNNWVFGTEGYPAGTYDLLFKANTIKHELTLEPTYVGPNTIAQMNALKDETEFAFTGNAIVVANVSKEGSTTINNYVYIKDATGYSLIYDRGGAYTNANAIAAGNVIKTPWTGKVSIYNGLFEVKPTGEDQLQASSTVLVEYPEGSVADLSPDSVNKVVEMKGLSIEGVDGSNIQFTIGNAAIPGYNQFGIELPTEFEGKTYDVLGAIGFSDDKVQFWPITITEAVTPEDVYTVAGAFYNSDDPQAICFGTAWDANAEANNMVLGADGIYTKNYTDVELEVGNIQFKVVKNHNWDIAYPENNYEIQVEKAGKYDLAIAFNPETNEVTAQLTSKDVPVEEEYTATFTTDLGWKQVYAYVWKGGIEAPVQWPGDEITGTLTEGVYTYTFKSTYAPEFIIFNDGTLEGAEVGVNKTEDLAFENGKAYELKKVEPQRFTASFTTDKDWKQVYAYIYPEPENGAWPGKDITETAKDGVYTYDFEAVEAPTIIIFNNGNEAEVKEQTGDLPFVDGTLYTLTTEKTTVWAGDADEPIPAEGIEISKAEQKYADVQPTNIVRIKAQEIVAAPARGLGNAVAELAAGDISIYKGSDPTVKLVPDDDIKAIPGEGYEFVADEDAANEINANGFIIKSNVPDTKQIAITEIEIEEVPQPVDYYVVGTMTDPTWTRTDAYKLAVNPEVEGEYMLETAFAANDKIKVQASDETWYPAGTDNDWVITEAGDYTVYFRPAGNAEWANGFFTVIKKAPEAIVYDFAAEQALIAAGTVAKPGNVGGNQNLGQGFYGWEKSDKTDSRRNDYKGYSKAEGSTLPDDCHLWRRSDRYDQDVSWANVGGLTCPNDREYAIDGLTPGSKVVIEYTAATEGDQIIWATGDGSSEGLSLRAAATIGGAEAVSGETAIPSGAEILVTKVTPAVQGTGYIVVKVKKNMVISKITVTVNEDAKAYAVNVSDAIENGTVKVNRPTAYVGDEVVVTATPAEGYKLDAITVTGVNTNEAVVVTDGKFIMPADAVNVSATFVEKLDYYLVGNMTDWKPNAEYKLTANTAAEGVEEYMITVDLAADAQFKIAKSNGTTIDDANWYPSGMGNNYGENGELQGAGKYTVYFRPNADGGDDWFYHVIFAQKFYNITVVNCDGMTITPEATEAAAGTKVWATVTMTEGYEPEFPAFTNTDTGDVIDMTEGTDVGMDEETGKVWIIMPAQNLTITAKAAKVSLITLDLSQENGSATCISVNAEDPTSFYKKEGKEIYLTVTPNAGYTADITVTAGEDPVEVIAEAGTYHEQAYTHKFIMPAKDVTVKVIFTKADAINGIAADDADGNAPIYNLAGQKVTKSYKGVVIKNGKKVYQK